MHNLLNMKRVIGSERKRDCDSISMFLRNLGERVAGWVLGGEERRSLTSHFCAHLVDLEEVVILIGRLLVLLLLIMYRISTLVGIGELLGYLTLFIHDRESAGQGLCSSYHSGKDCCVAELQIFFSMFKGCCGGGGGGAAGLPRLRRRC